jgi:hypothetical protein
VSLVSAARQLAKRTILASQPAATEGTWHVTPAELKGFEIHWPVTLGWAPGWTWVEPLFRGFSARTRVVRREIPQRLDGTVLIEVRRNGRSHRVALNYSDYPQLVHLYKEGAAEGLELEFKMQYLKGGYGLAQVIPGGFIADSMLVEWFARGARRLRERQQFTCDVYGRFGLNFATQVRTQALNALAAQTRFRFYGGGDKVDYQAFLREVGGARVCVDLPGNGPFCFRLVNYLAVGACVVSPPHATEMPVPLIDRQHIVYTRPDMSDLVDLCEHYAHDAPAREAIAHAARSYYRANLYWRSLADYYLRMMLDRWPA